MDDLTKGLIDHLKRTSPGLQVKYFDASAGIPASALNSIEEPAFPPKTVYKDLPTKGTKMPNDRDTHFLGFAKLLMQDVDERNRAKAQAEGHYLDEEELRLIIAQRAYDLALCVIADVFDHIATGGDQFEAITCVDDLTGWPQWMASIG